MTEIESLKKQIAIARTCFDSAMELADYATAHQLAEKMTLLTKQILLCQQQAIEEAK